jgi:hypothetical protein
VTKGNSHGNKRTERSTIPSSNTDRCTTPATRWARPNRNANNRVKFGSTTTRTAVKYSPAHAAHACNKPDIAVQNRRQSDATSPRARRRDDRGEKKQQHIDLKRSSKQTFFANWRDPIVSSKRAPTTSARLFLYSSPSPGARACGRHVLPRWPKPKFLLLSPR